MRTFSSVFVLLLYGCLSIWFLYVGLYFAEIGPDAGYYLPTAERIAAGVVPFKEISIGYTPLGIYHFALIPYFSAERPHYEDYLILLYSLEIASAILVYLLASFFTPFVLPRLITSLSTLYGILFWEGYAIGLEVFVVFYTLLALLCALRSKQRVTMWALSGIFAACAFLSKQYGIAVVFPCAFALIHSTQDPWTRFRALIIFLGTMATTAVFVLAAPALFFDGSMEQIVNQLLWGGLSNGKHLKYYANVTISLEAIGQFFVRFAPGILLMPLLFLRRADAPAPFFITLAGLTVFALPLSIATFQHYFILMIPFVALLNLHVAVQLQKLVELRQIGSRAGNSMIAMVAFLPLVSSLEFADLSAIKNTRANQLAQAAKISQSLPPRSQVLMFAEPVFNYLLDLYPSNQLFPGYGFVPSFDAVEIAKMIREANLLLIDPKNAWAFSFPKKKLSLSGISFESLTDSQFSSSPIEGSDGFILLRRIAAPIDAAPREH